MHGSITENTNNGVVRRFLSRGWLITHAQGEKPRDAKRTGNNEMLTEIYIGIDPDVDLNGVAVVNKKSGACEVYALGFCALMDWLAQWVGVQGVEIIVEAGWLNDSVWHLQRKGLQWAASVGRGVGRNHQTGILIADMAEHMGLSVTRQRPLRKCWKGHDGKITHEEIKYFTGIKTRTNQETRDALLLAWVAAGLPVKVKPLNFAKCLRRTQRIVRK